MHRDMWTAINFKKGKGGRRKGVFGVKRLIARSPGLASCAAGCITLSRYFIPDKRFRWEQWDVACKDGGAKIRQAGKKDDGEPARQRFNNARFTLGAFLHLTFNAA